MESPTPFAELLKRLRVGDEGAVRELVETYEPYLRRTIRRRLNRTRFQAVADSADLCQSVLGSFLIHCIAGDFEIDSREALTQLLLGMARKKLAELMRNESADRRDRARTFSLGSNPKLADGKSQEPSQILAGRELLEAVRARLPEHERQLFELRQQGLTWDVIADRLGENAVQLRKRLSRALRQIALELGLENDDG